MEPFFALVPIICGGIVAFFLGSIWYSERFFMNWWLEGRGMRKEMLPNRPASYMTHVMLYTLFICTAMTAVLAFVLDALPITTLCEAVATSVMLALGFIGLKDFSDMLYSMPETFWSIQAQKKFAVDVLFYVVMFALVTVVMYYVQAWF